MEIRRLTSWDEPALVALFEGNDTADVTAFFDPFPLTADSARAIAGHVGRDRYWGVLVSGRIVGLCMARGWDAGHEHRSMGLVIDGEWRSTGIGVQATALALAELRAAGEVSVRARVHAANNSSRRVAAKLGFEEVGRQAGQIVLECDLTKPVTVRTSRQVDGS